MGHFVVRNASVANYIGPSITNVVRHTGISKPTTVSTSLPAVFLDDRDCR